MNILVAEDEPLLIRAIEGRLKKDGYTVQSAADGQQALHQIQKQPPDLIITDIMMPYASGLEIIARIAQHLRYGVDDDRRAMSFTAHH